jgi:hypothetical protein
VRTTRIAKPRAAAPAPAQTPDATTTPTAPTRTRARLATFRDEELEAHLQRGGSVSAFAAERQITVAAVVASYGGRMRFPPFTPEELAAHLAAEGTLPDFAVRCGISMRSLHAWINRQRLLPVDPVVLRRWMAESTANEYEVKFGLYAPIVLRWCKNLGIRVHNAAHHARKAAQVHLRIPRMLDQQALGEMSFELIGIAHSMSRQRVETILRGVERPVARSSAAALQRCQPALDAFAATMVPHREGATLSLPAMRALLVLLRHSSQERLRDRAVAQALLARPGVGDALRTYPFVVVPGMVRHALDHPRRYWADARSGESHITHLMRNFRKRTLAQSPSTASTTP